MLFRQLFDPESSTYTYLLADEDTREAVLIDSVLEQVDRDLGLIEDLGLKLVYALDTHVHADHVTGSSSLRERTGCTTVVSERAGVSCADRLVKEGDRIRFGAHELEVLETPGHTNGCLSFVTSDRRKVFTGDALLVRGTGRTDFQQGDAHELYRSITGKLFLLPDDALVYPGHDYKGRTATSIGEEKRLNPRLGHGKTEDDFVEIMSNLGLPYPKKIDVALPANLRCGSTSAEPEPSIPTTWPPVEISSGGIPEVSPAWVERHRTAARLVDVRERNEFEGELGRVHGSELVPLDSLPVSAADWDRSRPVVLICRSGGRSGKAAVRMLSMGFASVASMRGGMIAWREERLPTEHGREVASRA